MYGTQCLENGTCGVSSGGQVLLNDVVYDIQSVASADWDWSHLQLVVGIVSIAVQHSSNATVLCTFAGSIQSWVLKVSAL